MTVLAQDEEKESAKSEKAVAAKTYADEIQALSQKPNVRKALAMFPECEAWTRQNLITLTEIPAPPFLEEVRGRAYADMLRKAGADSVWIDEVGNVLAKRRGRSGQKTVVLEAHLDTVFPAETDVKVKMRGDTLYAPGAVVGDGPSGSIETSNPLVQRAIAATSFVGASPALRVGSANSNIPFSKGVPAITMGAGGKVGGAHALSEWWLDDKSHLAMQRTLLVLLAEAGVQ